MKITSLGFFPLDENFTFCRTGGRTEPLHLKTMKDIGIGPISEFRFQSWVEGIEAGGEDDGSHMKFNDLFFHSIIDGFGLTGLGTLAAIRTSGTVETTLCLLHRLLRR